VTSRNGGPATFHGYFDASERRWKIFDGSTGCVSRKRIDWHPIPAGFEVLTDGKGGKSAQVQHGKAEPENRHDTTHYSPPPKSKRRLTGIFSLLLLLLLSSKRRGTQRFGKEPVAAAHAHRLHLPEKKSQHPLSVLFFRDLKKQKKQNKTKHKFKKILSPI